jgi:hypothetical protein
MKHWISLFTCVLLSIASAAILYAQDGVWHSSIVYKGPDGKLVYVSDEEGNRIPDFSHAGYHNGERQIPTLGVVKIISPVEGDNTEHIQAAIDEVEQREPDENGFRGALKLNPGDYEVSRTVYVRKSGVAIYGSGSGEDPERDTILRRTGTRQEAVIRIGGQTSGTVWGQVVMFRDGEVVRLTNITTNFVQVGSRTFDVEDASDYRAGDNIIIYHPCTQAWLEAIDGGGTGGSPNWTTGEQPILFNRYIQAIDGNTITIDAPVYNHLDRSLSQSYIYLANRANVVREVGIEDLRITIETLGPLAEDHAREAIVMHAVEDGWVDNIVAEHFWYAAVHVSASTRVTVQNSEGLKPHSLITGSRRYTFAVSRSQLVLFQHNYADESRHAYVGNGTSWDSGIVFLNNVGHLSHTSSEGHRRWGTGFLWDRHVETGVIRSGHRVLGLYNRGDYGTSHGWALAHSVAWNCNVVDRVSGQIVVQKPPTGQNYAIGGFGRINGDGPFSNPAGLIEGTNLVGQEMAIPSLYEAQFAERMGLSVGAEREYTNPDRFEVGQNYPNPFNPSTVINVRLRDAADLAVDIFNMLGQKVENIALGFVPSGFHEVRLDGSRYSSGIYLVQVRAGGEVREFKMTLVK